MTPSERVLGEQIGELRGEVRGVGEAVRELREVNSTEHAANAARMERIETSFRDALDRKADKAVVDGQAGEIKSLVSTRDKGRGAANVAKVIQGIALLALPVLGLLIGKGIG